MSPRLLLKQFLSNQKISPIGKRPSLRSGTKSERLLQAITQLRLKIFSQALIWSSTKIKKIPYTTAIKHTNDWTTWLHMFIPSARMAFFA